MKNKKKLFLIVGIVVFLLVGILSLVYMNNKSENYNFSSLEKRWIDSNKNKIIDISLFNDVPLFSLEEKGVVHNFLEYFEQTTSLEFSKTTCCGKDDNSEIKFIKIDDNQLSKDQLLVYSDYFVVLSRKDFSFFSMDELVNEKIGIVSESESEIKKYLENDFNLSYELFDDYEELFTKLKNKDINYIVVPKNEYLSEIIINEYTVVYKLSALNNTYVFDLSGSKELKTIFTKKYKEWISLNYEKQINQEMNDYYTSLSKIDEKKITEFKGRVFIYGYVENLPYDIERTNGHYGINSELLSEFELFSGAKINYKKYKSVEALEEAFNKKNVDIIFNYHSYDKIEKANLSLPVYTSNYVILSHIDNNVTIDSFASLKGKTIYTIKDTQLANYINTNSGAEVKTYSRINNLLKNKEPLVLLDINVYNYYKNSKLKDYYIIYEGNADVNYNFMINIDDINDTFSKIFQFYIMNSNPKAVINLGISKLLKVNFFNEISETQYILIVVVLILSILMMLKKGKKNKNLKEKNSKYIDSLTSLKNRNYLIDNIEKWDEGKLLPKTIIVIDLNRLKDVNNNFGYKEGDRLIKAAANILVSNQINNTEIIRTDGNEFMVYLIGHEKGEIVDYIKKLNKLFKDLPYEHGATLGYSIINDDIKELEDAINEATLDMLTNKENRELDV